MWVKNSIIQYDYNHDDSVVACWYDTFITQREFQNETLSDNNGMYM